MLIYIATVLCYTPLLCYTPVLCYTGMTTALFSFVGYEASAHVSEETKNSAVAAPRGIIYTVLSTGIGGIFILLALLFSYKSSNGLDDYSLAGTGNLVVDIFIFVAGPQLGEGLTWLVVINLFFAGVSSVTITGRITYALTRDGAFVFRIFKSS